MAKNVIVLGMHRGGTSLTANLVNNCGFYAGNEKLLLKGDNRNARGYWEYTPLIGFNNELLSSIRAREFIPPSDEDYEELERKSSEPKYRDMALQLLEAMQENARAWFWKDPRLAVLLPFWKNIWGDVLYVVSVRHPIDIAFSLQKWHKYPISASLLIWQRYMSAILKGTETAQNILFVEYEKLIENPIQQCERLYDFLTQAHSIIANRQLTIENMVRTIIPELRHNSTASLFSVTPQATDEQKALYDILKRKTENPIERVDHTIFTIYPGWREYLLVTSAMVQLWFLIPETEKSLALSRMHVAYKELCSYLS
jgi:hypothetical protein